MTGALLSVVDLSMRFGGLWAVEGLSFEAQQGEITAIIGPNGAGKTTVFNCITGFYRPTSGKILLNRNKKNFEVQAMPDHAIARDCGIARTFQNIRLFAQMTVLENLLVAQHNALQRSLFGLDAALGLSGFDKRNHRAMELARYWLDKVGLLDCADYVAGELPYGAQRRLEIARAMCSEPALICLDEPAAGLNPKETAEMSALLLDIKSGGHASILLIEHDMRLVMDISDHIVVLDHGRKISSGAAGQVRCDPVVIKAYLGEEYA